MSEYSTKDKEDVVDLAVKTMRDNPDFRSIDLAFDGMMRVRIDRSDEPMGKESTP